MLPIMGWGATTAKYGDEAAAIGRRGRAYWDPDNAGVDGLGDGAAPNTICLLSRQDYIDFLVKNVGANIKHHPLRQAYERAVANIAQFSRQRIDELGAIARSAGTGCL
ncbi:hypothetical protein HC928_09665 [bacterium]|nr:hypothetical protein [bacterium]